MKRGGIDIGRRPESVVVANRPFVALSDLPGDYDTNAVAGAPMSAPLSQGGGVCHIL